MFSLPQQNIAKTKSLKKNIRMFRFIRWPFLNDSTLFLKNNSAFMLLITYTTYYQFYYYQLYSVHTAIRLLVKISELKQIETSELIRVGLDLVMTPSNDLYSITRG